MIEPERLQRTAVIGTSCSGKTTFARSLAQVLQVPHIELDTLHWLPGWNPRPRDEFRQVVADAVAADSWILDGNYSKSRDVVWLRATCLIWLNYPFHVVLGRALSRTVRRVFDGQELFAGNRETFRQAFMSRDSILLWVLQTYHRRKREYPQLFREYRDSSLHSVVLRSQANNGTYQLKSPARTIQKQFRYRLETDGLPWR
jgi:adenylate kinase family enzyme